MAFKKHKISYEYSTEGIKATILRQAKSLKIPSGWAQQIADRVAEKTDKWIADKAIVTEDDLRKVIIKELDKLNADLAYAYRNHDKII
jgi:2-phosphoglycerate kinase